MPNDNSGNNTQSLCVRNRPDIQENAVIGGLICDRGDRPANRASLGVSNANYYNSLSGVRVRGVQQSGGKRNSIEKTNNEKRGGGRER